MTRHDEAFISNGYMYIRYYPRYKAHAVGGNTSLRKAGNSQTVNFWAQGRSHLFPPKYFCQNRPIGLCAVHTDRAHSSWLLLRCPMSSPPAGKLRSKKCEPVVTVELAQSLLAGVAVQLATELLAEDSPHRFAKLQVCFGQCLGEPSSGSCIVNEYVYLYRRHMS